MKALILVGMAVCLIPVCQAYVKTAQHREQQEDLREMVTEASVQYPVQADSAPQELVVSVLSEQAVGKESGQTENNPVMLAGYAALYEENKDLAGWLSIEDTKIDYPVMQKEDNTYYLHHDFYGEDSKYGCLYVKERINFAVEIT